MGTAEENGRAELSSSLLRTGEAGRVLTGQPYPELSMSPAKRVGRLIGTLLLVQLVGLILPFVLVLPITTADFMEHAPAAAPQIRLAVLLLFANGVLTLYVAISAYPLLREYGHRLALWLFAMSVLWLSMQAVDNAHIMSMLSLSQRYAELGAASPELLGTLAQLARSSRRWMHYTELLAIEGWFLVFYAVLFRCGLVPRPLAAFGMLMVLLHAAGITLPMFIGYGSMPQLAVSLGLSHLALAGWLVVRGFHAPALELSA
jgi:Domain of unknown function (DUF4386)